MTRKISWMVSERVPTNSFVEVFYEAVQGRHIYSAESNVFDVHLTNAVTG